MPALRPAHPLDAGRVAAILSDWVDATPWLPRVHTRGEDLAHAGMLIDRGWVRIAEAGGAVAGFLARDGADIHALYVAQTARSRGIGSALLAEAQAASARLSLWTFEANTAAHRFYEAAGFTVAARTDGAGNDEHLPDRRYDWSRKEAPQ